MVNRINVAISGLPGGPGVNTFYSTDLSAMRSALGTFYNSLQNALVIPFGVIFTIPDSGDVINSATGVIEGSWTAEPQTPTPSAVGDGQAWAAPAGCTVKWTTGTVADGGRVVGRTFLVPLLSTAYQSNGTLDEVKRESIRAAAQAMQTNSAPGFVIWHRPRAARAAAPGVKPLTAHDGSLAIVTGTSVPDKVAMLRSRRD